MIYLKCDSPHGFSFVEDKRKQNKNQGHDSNGGTTREMREEGKREAEQG
jgi:hypothetical protein